MVITTSDAEVTLREIEEQMGVIEEKLIELRYAERQWQKAKLSPGYIQGREFLVCPPEADEAGFVVLHLMQLLRDSIRKAHRWTDVALNYEMETFEDSCAGYRKKS